MRNDFEQIFNAKKAAKHGNVVSNNTAWIYTRVSTKDQAVNFSLKNQKNAANDFAIKNNLNVTNTFGGTYESAKMDFTRKAFTKMIDEKKDN